MNQHTYRWPSPVSVEPGNKGVCGVVTVSAPEPALNADQFQQGLDWLRQQGFDVRVGQHATGQAGFLAGAPLELASDLHTFLCDPEITWIATSGGGANANRLLSHLDYTLIAQHPKPILGLSNPSVLLNAITARSGVVTFHGPAVVWNFGDSDGLDPYTEKHLWLALGRSSPLQIQAEPSWQWLRSGRCSGPLFGGNIWSVQQLLGTPYTPDWRGAILFIEDCFTELHQIDAMLTHYQAAGVFDELAGLVIGVPESCEETEYLPAPSFEEIVMDLVAPYEFPVLSGVHLGHTPTKVCLPIGGQATLDSSEGTFTIL